MDFAKERFFIDTNFILDIVLQRRVESKELLEKIIKSKGYCCSSSFAVCEVIDKIQEFTYSTNLLLKERRGIDEIIRIRKEKRITQKERVIAVDKVRKFFNKYSVDIFTIKEEGWNNTLKLLENLEVDACDSVHIATALVAKCSVFVTIDEQLGHEVEKTGMHWLSPKHFNAKTET